MTDPWMKFYPRDWRGDQALRAVSLAARGLWIECLCIMHEAKPYGHLLLNGAPVGGDTLARMTGVSVDEVSALMAELRQAGVLSVTGKGVVISRRMVRDAAKAALRGFGRKVRLDELLAPDGAPSWRRARRLTIERDGRVCHYCGSTEGPFDVDHVIARIRGGSDDLRNLVVACASCNRSKGSKLVREWLQ